MCRAVASLAVSGGQEFHLPHFFLKSRLSFIIFPLTFTHFLPHFGPPGGRLAHPGRPLLRHWACVNTLLPKIVFSVATATSGSILIVQVPLRDRSQTLVRGAWCKKGVLKIFYPCKRGPEKITTDFPLKLSLHVFLCGWPVIFMAKRGPWIIFFFCGLKGGGAEKISR